MKPVWNVYRRFIENAPCDWLVSTRAFKGVVIGACPEERHAKLLAEAPEMLKALVDLENWATARGAQPNMNIQPVLAAREVLNRVAGLLT